MILLNSINSLFTSCLNITVFFLNFNGVIYGCSYTTPEKPVIFDGCYNIKQALGHDDFCGCKVCISLQGDCDNDNQCDIGLKCGKNNCLTMWAFYNVTYRYFPDFYGKSFMTAYSGNHFFDKKDDCCYSPGECCEDNDSSKYPYIGWNDSYGQH